MSKSRHRFTLDKEYKGHMCVYTYISPYMRKSKGDAETFRIKSG